MVTFALHLRIPQQIKSMNTRLLALVLLLLTTLVINAPLFAQENSSKVDSTANMWKPEVVGKLAGSQAGFQNWAEGGVNTLVFTVGIDGKAERQSSNWKQKITSKLSFGLVKQDTLAFRKAEDLIRITATFGYTGKGFLDKLRPTIAFQARTQFAPGFNFEKNPFGDGRKPPVKVSDFMSPGTFTQSIGLAYQVRPWISQRLGIGGKETVVMLKDLRTLYTLNRDETVRLEIGLEAFTDIDKEIFKNVFLKSTLGLFAAFNKPESPDFIWENVLNMKVNSWLQVNFEWSALYDSDISSKAQLKEVFSVGISYHII